MHITFLGVGEACDQQFGNTSVLVNTSNSSQFLLDCGFSVPHRYFNMFDDPEKPDTVWISHFHGDHFFGIPLLLLRLWEMGRINPLTIIGRKGVAERIIHALDTAYNGFSKKLQYELIFKELEPGKNLNHSGVTLHAAQTIHAERNLGLLLDDGSKKIYYSGDGRPSEMTKELTQNCDLIIHESFKMVDDYPNHGSITSCLKLLKESKAKRLAFVHLERNFRRNQTDKINALLFEHPNTLLPEDGMETTI